MNPEEVHLSLESLPRQPRRTGETRDRRSGTTDLLRLYLQDIGRVDLLTNEEEVTLARLVQRRETLLQQQHQLADSDAAIGELHRLEKLQRQEANRHSHWPTKQEWARAAGLTLQELQHRIETGYQAWGAQAGLDSKELKLALRNGRRAKDHMIQANLRLVVAVAKKYQQRGMELLDLVQEGTLGLERAVEKFDPTRGFRFSTYAYWWIRQSITRCLDQQSRTIRAPLHLSELRFKWKKIVRNYQQENMGAMPDQRWVASELGVSYERLQDMIDCFKPVVSLDRLCGDDTERNPIIEVISDERETKAAENYAMVQEDLEKLVHYMNVLTDREKFVIDRHFGLTDQKPLTYAKIAELMPTWQRGSNVLSRERIRQIKERALVKMRLAAGEINSVAIKFKAQVEIQEFYDGPPRQLLFDKKSLGLVA